jgi:hypothetical protein
MDNNMKLKLHTILFYVLQFTWGIILNFIGGVIALILIACGHQARVENKYIILRNPSNRGSFNCGIFVFTSTMNETVLRHEMGHGIQNVIYGPFMVLFGAASAIRFWYREWYKTYRYDKTGKQLPDYCAFWFEKQAQELGDKIKL